METGSIVALGREDTARSSSAPQGKMGLTFDYDLIGDSLMVTVCPIFPEQETEELGDDMLARLNPVTGVIEAIEIFFWSRRLAAGESVVVPVVGMLGG